MEILQDIDLLSLITKESTNFYNMKITTYNNNSYKINLYKKSLYRNYSINNKKNKDTSTRDVSMESYQHTIKKIYETARSNSWDWFITITFNENKIDRFDYNKVVKKLTEWLDSRRRKDKNSQDFGYIIVPEQHENGAWHFHGLFNNCDKVFNFKDSGIKKNGQIIYNMKKWKYGFTTATRIQSQQKVSKYICKYIKPSMFFEKNRKRYYVSKNLNKPKVNYLITDIKFWLDLYKDYDIRKFSNTYNDYFIIDNITDSTVYNI